MLDLVCVKTAERTRNVRSANRERTEFLPAAVSNLPVVVLEPTKLPLVQFHTVASSDNCNRGRRRTEYPVKKNKTLKCMASLLPSSTEEIALASM